MNSLKKIYDIEVAPPAEAWINISNELDVLKENESLATKINSLEAAPPATVWNRIAASLDGETQHQKISALLYNTEVKPPAGCWENIANDLDEQKMFSTVADKLSNLELSAPAATWDNITKELDDQDALDVIERKLANLQVHPPASAWLGIRKELEGKKEQPSLVVPMHHGWLKYAAAACFIAIVSVTAFFILNDNIGNGAGYTAGGSSQSANDLGGKNIVSAPITSSGGNTQQQVLQGIKTNLGNAYSVSIEKNKELQNRYIILMTQDGNVVRMSKKVSNMADCIAGEDHSCDDQISKWQKEMASSNTPSSPDNFLDILDIASEENGNETNL